MSMLLLETGRGEKYDMDGKTRRVESGEKREERRERGRMLRWRSE